MNAQHSCVNQELSPTGIELLSPRIDGKLNELLVLQNEETMGQNV